MSNDVEAESAIPGAEPVIAEVIAPTEDDQNKPPSQAGEWQFRFAGSGKAYFHIWIVNLCLSILTLGIYSAWAKVRREQFFHRHLLLGDTAFDYHGKPMTILKGRAIAVLFMIVLSVAQKLGPLAYGLALLCVVPLVPWLAVRALRFRAAYSSYRGLHFSFHGTYGEAFRVFVLYGGLVALTLGLTFPVWYRRVRQFVFANLRYGSGQFACLVTDGQIYGAILWPMVKMLGGIVMLAIVFGVIGSGISARSAVLGGVLAMLGFIAFQATIVPWVSGRLINVVWNRVELNGQRFQSRLQIGPYVGLTLSNWLLTLLTLGLYFPWARVRMARYRAESMTIAATCDLDAFVAGELQKPSALGDQAADMFDLDIAL